ncbi:nucleotidyltransferase family protein [Polynucleobacter sp.]|uniref:nucleotidyltransferase family protein n=1 Tax=Polynucleobacter sp. TaxID=2029855 RepID=UPI0033418D12
MESNFLFIISLMTTIGKSTNKTKTQLAILLLAAGEGSRLGGFPKALLKKDGQTLLHSFCLSMQALSPIEIVIVTGFHAQEIDSELASIDTSQLPVRMIRNPHPEAGQAASVRYGLEALKSNYDALIVALCDQPDIGALEIEALLELFTRRDTHHEIVLPMVNGQRGNPVVFSRKVIDFILAIPKMACRPYMDQYPELVLTMNTDKQAYILDADTELDIQALGLTK